MGKPKGFVQLFALIVLFFGLFLSPISNQITLTEASSNCQQLYIQVSADSINWSTYVNLPNGSTKYFIKATDTSPSGANCSTDFQAGVNSGNKPWSTYVHSGADGIARVDLMNYSTGLIIGNGTYSAQFRPCYASINIQDGTVSCQNPNGVWSNSITVVVNNTGGLPAVDLSSYYQSISGYNWTYTDLSDFGNVSGLYPSLGRSGSTRVQVEGEVSCNGLTLRPWRFTKDNAWGYWGGGKDSNLRWMVTSPNFFYPSGSPYTNLNKYIWVQRDKRYATQNPPAASDLRDLGPLTGGGLPLSEIAGVPAKEEFLIRAMTGSSYIEANSNNFYTTDTGLGCPNPPLAPSGSPIQGSWGYRVEYDTIPDNTQFGLPRGPFDGAPALRIDFLEGGQNLLATISMNRESWYFVKNVGLVEAMTKIFNNYAGSNARFCVTDADCLNNTMRHPDSVLSLNQYFQNPPFSAYVAPDNGTCSSIPSDSSFQTAISTTPQNGYWLKTSPGYTGYLEASASPGSNPFKWNWVNSGYTCVNTWGLPYKSYNAVFREWIPNETFPGESRVGTNNLPWSNQITVTLQQNVQNTPTPTPTPTFTPTPTLDPPSPTPTPTPTKQNISLDSYMNNVTVANSQNVQWITFPPYTVYTLSGTVSFNSQATASIQADIWDNTNPSNLKFIRTVTAFNSLNNKSGTNHSEEFRLDPNRVVAIILRATNGSATFTNVSLIQP